MSHEYGHYLENTISEGDNYYGDSTHEYCTYGKDEEFAWKEGFSEYLGTIVPYTYRTALSGSDVPLTRSNPGSTAETPNCGEYGIEGEATVASVLWDLVDTTSFPGSGFEVFDTISGKETMIINILDNELDGADNIEDAGDLCEFVEQGWNCRMDGAEKTAIEALLSNYGVECDTECD